jgi:hypothetical protein
VHAGIQPGVPLEDQDPADLMWIRDSFLFDTRDHGVLVVHGHTPVATVEHHGNRLAIDTGAGWDGPVSAVVIEGREAWLLTDRAASPWRGSPDRRARSGAGPAGRAGLGVEFLGDEDRAGGAAAAPVRGLRFAILVPLIALFPAPDRVAGHPGHRDLHQHRPVRVSFQRDGGRCDGGPRLAHPAEPGADHDRPRRAGLRRTVRLLQGAGIALACAGLAFSGLRAAAMSRRWAWRWC